MKTTPWTLMFLLALVAPANAADNQPAVQFDAARLKTGTFTYRDSIDGKPGNLSTSTITHLADGRYRFTADIPTFDQSWDTIATRAMGPVSTELKMRTRDGRRYVMRLKYAGLKVSGDVATSGSADRRLPASDQAVAGDITPDTVDQRIDWASVMTTDKQPRESFDFKVYDAKTALSRVHCEVSDAGTMVTPTGKMSAIRYTSTVYKASGTEVYTVYTSAAYPRMMPREDLSGNLLITLTDIKP